MFCLCGFYLEFYFHIFIMICFTIIIIILFLHVLLYISYILHFSLNKRSKVSLNMNSSFSSKLLSAFIFHPCTRIKTFVYWTSGETSWSEPHSSPSSTWQFTFVTSSRWPGRFPQTCRRWQWSVIDEWTRTNRNIKPKIKECQRYNVRDGWRHLSGRFPFFSLPRPVLSW